MENVSVLLMFSGVCRIPPGKEPRRLCKSSCGKGCIQQEKRKNGHSEPYRRARCLFFGVPLPLQAGNDLLILRDAGNAAAAGGGQARAGAGEANHIGQLFPG